jgi:cytochrome c biogenesis protein CcdA
LADDAVGIKTLATAVLLLVMLLPLTLPVLAVTVLGHRADSGLAKTNAYVSRHQSTINGIVIIVIALLVGYKAL